MQQHIKKIPLRGKWIFFAHKNNSTADDHYSFAILPEWSDKEKLEKEQEIVGFYISSHPLETYKKQLSWFNIESFELALEKAKTNNTEYTTISCGLLKSRKDIVTKKGDRMSFLQFEDMSGTMEIIAFPKTFARAEKWLNSHNVFIIKGTVDVTASDSRKIKANDIVPIELALNEWPNIEYINLTLPDNISETTITTIKNQIIKGTTPLHIIFHENQKKLRLTAQEKVLLDTASAQLLESHNIIIQCHL